jgi:two-component system cell cycle response regulator
MQVVMARMPRSVTWGYLVAGAWLLAAAVRNAAAPDLDVGPLFHRYAHDVFLGLVGALCLVRVAVRRDAERLPWALIGAGILAWTVGEVYYSGVLWTVDTVPFPSPADGGYLLMPPLVLAGAVSLLRRRHPALSATVRVDALTAALAVGSVCASLVFDTVRDSVQGDPLGAATALAYPLWDLVIGGFAVGAVAAVGRRAGRTWLWLGAGVVVFWVSDSLYLVKTANGTFTSPSWFDAGWWGGLACLSLAAWQPAPRDAQASGREGFAQILIPLLFALAGLGVLVAGAASQLNAVAILLAAGALVAVMLRLALTFRENLRMLGYTRDEALTDPLTALANRRALSRDLERALAAADDAHPLVLVLFDLDGFKLYNDSFGHPAGDDLLVRLGHKLEQQLSGRGRAYRMGGDEFCVLFAPGETVAEPIIAAAAAALSESGEGFDIGCSYGSIFLPREAADASEALRIADQRMYAQKSAGRTSAGRQSSDVLLRALAERHPALSSHPADVADLAHGVARRLGLEADVAEQVRLAAELHDVGKVAIPDSILDKPGPLDETEWAFMRRHTLIGERIVSAAPALQAVARMVRATHERWDGGGYPDGLARDAIPLGARIVAVADAFDAMTSSRPYSGPRPVAEALAELRRCAGTQFDPVVVDAFCAVQAAQAARAQVVSMPPSTGSTTPVT